MRIKERETNVKKDRSGWTAETLTTVNGQTFLISTSKGNGLIVSNAIPTEASQDGVFSVLKMGLDDFNSKINLLTNEGKATEKAIRHQHGKALIEFDRKVQEGEIQPEQPEKPDIGYILFLDGYGKTKNSKGNNHIIYAIDGNKYKTVERDTLELSIKDHVRPWSKKFGIGIYFDPELKFTGTEDDLNNLIIEAQQRAKIEDERKAIEKEENEKERNEKIKQGAEKLPAIPKSAKTVIVAELQEDVSDSMSDYFHSQTVRTLYLAFSGHDRDIFSEMWKAINNCPELKEAYPEVNKDYEKREKYSMGRGYYIAKNRYSGWHISKAGLETSYGHKLEDLQIAISEGRYFITERNEQAEAVQAGDVQIINYSDRAIAVIGDTKPIKETLKALGGRFNFRLSCGPGWIFPKSKSDKIYKTLNI